jgi:hypothetical protein
VTTAELHNYVVTVMVVDRYWSIGVYVEGAESAAAARAAVQQQLDELPVVGVTGSFTITEAQRLPL